MDSQNIIWVRHTWDLNNIEIRPQAPAGYLFNSSGTDGEQQVVNVVLSAYASDPMRMPMMSSIRERMIDHIQTTLGQIDADYLVARRGKKFVAVSGIAKQHWTGQNLLTGICVLPEHQHKGLGRYLLGLSLLRLKQMGLCKAQAYTEYGSVADMKIYSLFGSQREEGVQYPDVEQK